MLVLPIGNTFLYVEPIYLQASEAKMPQLKKVVLAMGNTLIYADTYAQALAQLGGGGNIEAPPNEPPATVTAPSHPSTPTGDPRITEIKKHLDRYQDLIGQGKWSEAGKELEAIRGIVR